MTKIWIYLIGAGAVVAVLFGMYTYIDSRGYDRGKSAADKVCKDTTVPAATKAVQDQCDFNAKQTEKSNVKHDEDKDAAIARAERQRDSLRKQVQTRSSLPVSNPANVHIARTQTLRSTGSSGYDPRDELTIDLGEQCKVRSDEFLGCRQFLLDERKAVKP